MLYHITLHSNHLLKDDGLDEQCMTYSVKNFKVKNHHTTYVS